jgi:arylsulfatase A-like enzyme
MSRITRREFINATAAATAAAAVDRVASVDGAPRPNILFILADDLGYGDLSCYGRPDYATPVLDGLARRGLRFLSAYAAAPVCTPTRCALATGRYPHRLAVGLREPLKDRDAEIDIGLPPGHPTVASRLQAAGYATALVGKWHLGWKPEFGPNQHGYDEFFGILSGAADYFTHSGDLWENLQPIERVGYLTDLLSERAAQYVSRRRDRPFFLSLHYTAPHAPWEGPEDAAIGHDDHGDGPMTEGTRSAARVGNWKYLQEQDREYLFDVVNDPGEKSDQRRRMPETFTRLKSQYDAWNRQMLPRLP